MSDRLPIRLLTDEPLSGPVNMARDEALLLAAGRSGTSDDSGAARGPFFCFERRHCLDVLLDSGEDASLRAQIKRRTGRLPDEQLLDGGYLSRKGIEQASAEGVAVYVPLSPTAGQGQVCRQNKSDPPGVAAWRQRMNSEEGKAIYKLRSSTSETVNADLKTFRGLHAFTVRGLSKVRCAALWSALAYNVLHFAGMLMT